MTSSLVLPPGDLPLLDAHPSPEAADSAEPEGGAVAHRDANALKRKRTTTIPDFITQGSNRSTKSLLTQVLSREWRATVDGRDHRDQKTLNTSGKLDGASEPLHLPPLRILNAEALRVLNTEGRNDATQSVHQPPPPVNKSSDAIQPVHQPVRAPPSCPSPHRPSRVDMRPCTVASAHAREMNERAAGNRPSSSTPVPPDPVPTPQPVLLSVTTVSSHHRRTEGSQWALPVPDQNLAIEDPIMAAPQIVPTWPLAPPQGQGLPTQNRSYNNEASLVIQPRNRNRHKGHSGYLIGNNGGAARAGSSYAQTLLQNLRNKPSTCYVMVHGPREPGCTCRW